MKYKLEELVSGWVYNTITNIELQHQLISESVSIYQIFY